MGSAGRSVLITGGSRGLGLAIAERLAAEGCKVGLLARTGQQLDDAVSALRENGGEAAAFVADVLDPSSLRRAVGRHRSWAGGLDALICSAGQLKAFGPLALADAETWWRDLETSVRGVQLSVREALPGLRRSTGATVAVLVGPGHNGDLPFATGYGVAQAALARLVESLGRELAEDRVSVYAVNPGLVLTDLVRPLIDSPEGRRWLPQFNEAFAEGKEVGPEVVAEMITWLIDRRPAELIGRVVSALLPPAALETRLERIRSENLGVLRLR